MAGNSKATILIISYNEKEYLPRAIESCKKQTYGNTEIIIGDDGSNDGSIEYIRSLGDGIRHYVMQREAGDIIPSIRVSEVIKRGLRESTGDYFIVLSGDDYFCDDHMLEDAVKWLDDHPDHSAYVNGFKKVTDDSVLEEVIPKHRSPSVYWSGDYLHISCFVFRKMSDRDLLCRFCDDTGLEFILAIQGKWKYSDKIAFAYYQRPRSIMHEADPMELAILEAMIYQDILNYPKVPLGLKLATKARFRSSMIYIDQNSEQLAYGADGSIGESRYRKYLNNCEKYGNNVLRKRKGFLSMTFARYYYAVRRRLF